MKIPKKKGKKLKFWQTPENQSAFEYAKATTQRFAKSFYFSASILPEDRKWATYAIYGFCRYADNLIDNPRNRTNEELLNEVDNFANELEIAYRTGESEHPVISAFIQAANIYKIPKKYPLELLEGVKMDLTISRYETFDDLYVFCYRVAAVVGLMMTHVLGFKDSNAFYYAEKLGIGMQLTNILRDVQEDKELGRIYLPLKEMAKFSVTEREIFGEEMTVNLFELMKFQVSRAHSYYEESKPGIPMLEKNSQYAIYSASKIYRGILTKIEERNFNPFLGRVFVSKGKKLSILAQEIIRTRFFDVQESWTPKPKLKLAEEVFVKSE